MTYSRKNFSEFANILALTSCFFARIYSSYSSNTVIPPLCGAPDVYWALHTSLQLACLRKPICCPLDLSILPASVSVVDTHSVLLQAVFFPLPLVIGILLRLLATGDVRVKQFHDERIQALATALCVHFVLFSFPFGDPYFDRVKFSLILCDCSFSSFSLHEITSIHFIVPQQRLCVTIQNTQNIGTYSYILSIEICPYTCYNKITVKNTKQPGGAANLRRKL